MKDDLITKYKRKIEKEHPKTNKGTIVIRLKNGPRLIIRYMSGNMYSIERYDAKKKTRVLLELLGSPELIAKVIIKEKDNHKNRIYNKLK